jgi:hypothetical protein
MKLIAEYWKGEHGYDILYNDNAFCAYICEGKEFFIAEFFVKNRNNGEAIKFHKEIRQFAKTKGCTHLSGNIFVNNNWDNFNRKLKIHLRFGYRVVSMNELRAQVVCDL